MVKYLRLIAVILFLFYLTLPPPVFPPPPPGSHPSDEPGDLRYPDIRAFYSDLSRDEVIAYLTSQLDHSPLASIPLPVLRLKDYPPEEAQTRIMEQLKSSYLEELVHPLRESLYVSAFEPVLDKDAYIVDGIRYRNKVTVRYVTGSLFRRVAVGLGAIFSIWLIWKTILKLKSK